MRSRLSLLLSPLKPRFTGRLSASGLAMVVAMSMTVVSPGCAESGNDHWAEGLRLLGEAERNDCGLGYDKATGQQVISTGRISACLEKTKAGLVELHKARALGVDNWESAALIEKTEHEVEKLESMLATVSRMTHERVLD